MIGNQYKGRYAILYDRVLLYRRVTKEKKDSPSNLPIKVSALSVGVLMLFEDPQAPFARDTQAFHNPKITNIEVSIEGKPNQLFSQGMRAYHVWDEARKFFAVCPGDKRHPEVAEVAKDLALADVSPGQFLTTKYALWLDFRTTDDQRLQGNGRKLSAEMTIRIQRETEAVGDLTIRIPISHI